MPYHVVLWLVEYESTDNLDLAFLIASLSSDGLCSYLVSYFWDFLGVWVAELVSGFLLRMLNAFSSGTCC